MKQLTKILLINWHMFSCSEISVENNILITGHNGAGKSTLLDAVQYVLTGGKTKFNLAANEDGARKLEGYVRGRLGTESQEYLRTKDVTTHIALEFFDEEEQKHFVLGAVIDLPEGGKPREHFYLAKRITADKDLYIRMTGEILTKGQFERNLRRLKIHYVFPNTKEEARRLVTTTFSVNTKYTELVRRALAFKPIGNLNEFMYRFLLPEERINIDSLRQNVLEYRKFETTLKEQRARMEILERISNGIHRHGELLIEQAVNAYIAELIRIEKNTALKETLREGMKEKERERTVHESNKQILKSKLNSLLTQIAGIQAQMNALDANGRISSLKERERGLKERFAEQEKWAKDIETLLKKDIGLLNDLSVSHNLTFVKAEFLEQESFSDDLAEAVRKVNSMKTALLQREFEIKNEKEAAQKELDEVRKKIEVLERKNYPYEKNVQALIDLLKHELSKATGREIIVKPFCEYLELSDETWRNAIEGYLNTQRFDLFVEPQYFRKAARIYDQFKKDRGIFGTGIVDTGKLDSYGEIKPGTLAEKVTAENPYARNYANMILGKTDCEEDVEKLNTHHSAITPTCMIYRNHTVRAINPSVYAMPFIGRKAIELQLAKEKKNQESARSRMQNILRREKEANQQKELLSGLNLSYAYSFAANQQAYLSVKEEYQSVSSQLKELLKDPSWITLQEQMEVLNKEQLETSARHDKEQEKISRLNVDLEDMETRYYDTERALKEAETARDIQRDTLLDRMEQIESTYEKLKRNARGEFSRMEYQNTNRQKTTEDSLRDLTNEVRDTMHEYNLRTGYGFEETMEAKDLYTAQYDRLRTVDIEDSVNKTIEARRKCEKSFQEEFISTLRAKIERAKTNLRLLNKALEDKSFQGDRYAFVFEGSSDPTFALYYRILCSNQDYLSNSLFMEELSEQNRMVMDELFARLVAADSSEKNEKLLRDYTDYRKYMKYDIRITHANGDTTLFSKVNLEKSGGETQTPFYVIIAASFDQLAVARKGISNGCLVLFDEAFNNMDENRIEALMRFYRSLNIQLMIAVPEGRVRNIMPYTETTILLVKQNNRILSEEMIRHESES